MSDELPSSHKVVGRVRSGPEIVSDFVAALREDSTLDPTTVATIEDLLTKGKLTFVNLLKSLEELRGKTSV
jgi:hypothetical protein